MEMEMEMAMAMAMGESREYSYFTVRLARLWIGAILATGVARPP